MCSSYFTPISPLKKFTQLWQLLLVKCEKGPWRTYGCPNICRQLINEASLRYVHSRKQIYFLYNICILYLDVMHIWGCFFRVSWHEEVFNVWCRIKHRFLCAFRCLPLWGSFALTTSTWPIRDWIRFSVTSVRTCLRWIIFFSPYISYILFLSWSNVDQLNQIKWFICAWISLLLLEYMCAL